jgi:hypothetical protein
MSRQSIDPFNTLVILALFALMLGLALWAGRAFS